MLEHRRPLWGNSRFHAASRYTGPGGVDFPKAELALKAQNAKTQDSSAFGFADARSQRYSD